MDKKILFLTLTTLAATLAGCGGGQFNAKSPPATTTTTTEPAQSQGIQVTLESPQTGAMPNPVTVQASATGSDNIAGWAVYVDNQVNYQSNTHLNSLSVPLTLAAGSHNLYVRAWDQGGASGTSPTLQVTVNGASGTATPVATAPSAPAPAPAPSAPAPAPSAPAPAPSGPLPTPPASAQVFDHLQDTTDNWDSCSPCAGGSSTTTNFWSAPFQSTPAMSGSSREFFIGGQAWSNVLWIKKLPAQNSATHFIWDFWVYFDDASAASAWTAEYDLWQAIGGREFMIGSQCAFGDGTWDVWDGKNNKWIQSSVPCRRFAGSTWHHIQWDIERISSYQYRYNTLVVDGKAFTFNQVFEANPTDWSDGMGVQWQLDQDSSGTPLHQWIDNVKLTIW